MQKQIVFLLICLPHFLLSQSSSLQIGLYVSPGISYIQYFSRLDTTGVQERLDYVRDYREPMFAWSVGLQLLRPVSERLNLELDIGLTQKGGRTIERLIESDSPLLLPETVLRQRIYYTHRFLCLSFGTQYLLGDQPNSLFLKSALAANLYLGSTNRYENLEHLDGSSSTEVEQYFSPTYLPMQLHVSLGLGYQWQFSDKMRLQFIPGLNWPLSGFYRYGLKDQSLNFRIPRFYTQLSIQYLIS